MRNRIQGDIALHRPSSLAASSLAPPPPSNYDADATTEGTGASEGKQAWLVVYGSFMVFINIWGFVFIFGVFESFYQLSYLPSESASSISWIGTVQSALLSIIGVLAGPLYDLGLYRSMMISGACLVLLGLFMLSLSTEYYQIFLTQGICIGIGGGLLYVPSLALVTGTFKKNRSLAMGVVTCGIGIGGVMYLAVFQSLLPKLGFAWTVRVLAFIALVIFAISIPVLLFNTPGKQRSRSTRNLVDIDAVKDGPFVLYGLSSFCIFLGYLVPFFFIPSFAQIVLGTSRSLSFWALAISSAASILGRLGAALAAQKFDIMLPWTASAAISGALCLYWIRISTVATFFAFCGLYGGISGALVALPPSIFPRICKNPNLLGTWMGMGWLCSGTAFLIGSPIAGALINVGSSGSKDPNFLAVQLWSGLLLLLGAASLLVLWYSLTKRRAQPLWI